MLLVPRLLRPSFLLASALVSTPSTSASLRATSNLCFRHPTFPLSFTPSSAPTRRPMSSSSTTIFPEDSPLYHPYRLPSSSSSSNEGEEAEWILDSLDLTQAKEMATQRSTPLKFLVLYGSLRERSYSKLMAFEYARLLEHMGADVRVFDPSGLPMKDEVSVTNPKVVELRLLSEWSDGQVWVSPEQHGTITGVMKTQIDWIPLATGSVRPTQGRTLAVSQVNGGSQSFNTVNTLRILGRWMRMFTIPNQASLPKAWTAFTPGGRMLPSSNRERVVDVAEELVRVTCLLTPHSEMLSDRFSERKERAEHGRLRTQAETEALKKAAEEGMGAGTKEEQKLPVA